MNGPDYLKNPPEREKVHVEHSTKHTVVLKPGFYNRRNQSEYLKNSFPAGFQIKNKLTEKLGESILRDSYYSNPYGSFTEWTKGESVDDSLSADLTADPYADVAGPYLTEILASRPSGHKPLHDSNQYNSVVAKELPLHSRSSKYKPKRLQANSSSKPAVYNAPALLPTFTPALAQSKVVNNLVLSDSSEYDKWLAYQRSDMGEKSWLIKGNAEGHNYSAHDFLGDNSTAAELLATAEAMMTSPRSSQEEALHLTQMQQSSHPTLLTTLPQPLPPYITIEVHTLNQMVRTTKLCEDKHIVRTIDSRLTLSELKILITNEIVIGIETAFRLYEDSNIHKSGRMNLSRIELNFQYFHRYAQSWRVVHSESDWIHVKQEHRDELTNTLKLMYSLEKKSEYILLKEIQENYVRQQQERQLRETPHLSLKALTESMEKELKLKKKYVYKTSLLEENTAVKHTAMTHAGADVNTTGFTSSAHPKATGFLHTTKSSLNLPLAQQSRECSFNASFRSTCTGKDSALSSPTHSARAYMSNNSRPSSRAKQSGAAAVGAGGGIDFQDSPTRHSISQSHSVFSDDSSIQHHHTASAGSLLGIPPIHPSRGSLLPNSESCMSQSGSRSIFYPKRSDTLDKMYEQLESSIPRQQDFASNLEQRLFKTKW